MGTLYESENEHLLREQAKERGITPEELLREITDWVVRKPLRAAAKKARAEEIARETADPSTPRGRKWLKELERDSRRTAATRERIRQSAEAAEEFIAASRTALPPTSQIRGQAKAMLAQKTKINE